MRGLDRPSAEVVLACIAPCVWVWGVWFGFALRCVALLCGVCVQLHLPLFPAGGPFLPSLSVNLYYYYDMTLQLDFRSAFNSVSQTALLQAVASLEPRLLPFAAWAYRFHGPLVVRGAPADASLLTTQSGVCQGDPCGPLLFALALQAPSKGCGIGFRTSAWWRTRTMCTCRSPQTQPLRPSGSWSLRPPRLASPPTSPSDRIRLVSSHWLSHCLRPGYCPSPRGACGCRHAPRLGRVC
jgi:hypothetical protein